jgi:hypothetical protein
LRTRTVNAKARHEERKKAMKTQGFHRSKKANRRLLGGVLLFTVVFAWGGVGASEKYGMPSEDQARRQGYLGSGTGTEQVARVSSLRVQEDRLFVNGEPFILKRQTRFEDERGVRIGLQDIPLGAGIELEYQTGSDREESGYGPEAKILTRIRIVQPPQGKKPVR